MVARCLFACPKNSKERHAKVCKGEKKKKLPHLHAGRGSEEASEHSTARRAAFGVGVVRLEDEPHAAAARSGARGHRGQDGRRQANVAASATGAVAQWVGLDGARGARVGARHGRGVVAGGVCEVRSMHACMHA